MRPSKKYLLPDSDIKPSTPNSPTLDDIDFPEIDDLKLAPTEARATLGDLLVRHDANKLEKIRIGLETVERAALDRKLDTAVSTANRCAFWLINEEYTRRNVPPVLRNLPAFKEAPSDAHKVRAADDHDMNIDLWSVDLRWITCRYPQHLTKLKRLERVHDYRQIHRTVESAYWRHNSNGASSPLWRVADDFGLKREHQRQTAVLKSGTVKVHEIGSRKQLAAISEHLMERHVARMMRRNAVFDLTWEHQLTVTRRAEVWLAAELAGWKPAETAFFYNGRVGTERGLGTSDKPISRQLARKLIEEVLRDAGKGGKLYAV